MLRTLVIISAAVGCATILAIVFALLGAFTGWIADSIRIKKRDYAYAHRFDKPPTASCYCKDCQWHNIDTNQCSRYEYWFPDDGFCWYATPRYLDAFAEQNDKEENNNV